MFTELPCIIGEWMRACLIYRKRKVVFYYTISMMLLNGLKEMGKNMAQEFWIKWDVHSRKSFKTKWYLTKTENKAEAYGLFVWLVEELYADEDNWIPLDEFFLTSVSNDLGLTVEKVNIYINFLIEAKLFIIKDISANARQSTAEGGKMEFSSARVLDAAKDSNNRRLVRSQAGKKGAMITNTNRQMLGKSRQVTLDKNRLDKNRYNNKALTSHDFIFPELLNREVCIKAFDGWIEHRKELKKPLTKKAGELLLQKYKERAGDFIRDIKHSIMCGYQGVFPPKVEPPKFQPNESKQELNRNQSQLLTRVGLKDPVPVGKIITGLQK